MGENDMLNECFAYYDKPASTLRVGNSRIEKTVCVKGGAIYTKSVRDLKKGRAWEGGRQLWQRCPVIKADEEAQCRLESESVPRGNGMAEHLKARLIITGAMGQVSYEYIVFPDIPFIFNQIFVLKCREETQAEEETPQSVSCSGIEMQYTSNKDKQILCSSDTLDCIPLTDSHLTVQAYTLYDKTDRCDALFEKSEVTLYKNGVTERQGNVFCINDYVNGDSLMLIKHAPCESSALNRRSKDLYIQGKSYVALIGNGVDFSDLPAQGTPYYASAVGVGDSAEIYEELWRYSEAFSTGDPRQSLYVMSNTWGDRSQDGAVCESFILKELERAKELGVDVLQIDDGWQSGITSNSKLKSGGIWEGFYKSGDFWSVNAEKFPNGLEPLISKAKEYGIELGLWFAPDSDSDFENADRDIETLMGLHQRYGVRYFKLDGVKIRSKVGEMRFIRMLSELTKRTAGDMRFNIDVTAQDRFGYFYQQNFGTLFVENRYTDFVNYYPHNTFKNLWELSHIIPARRLQMELLNIRRNSDKYKGMPFAPSEYSMDYVFATVMPSNPLVWMEMSNLGQEDARVLSRITGIYQRYKKELFFSRVIPIGDKPNGMSFSGYFCKDMQGGYSHLLLFRESTAEKTYTFRLPCDVSGKSAELLYESAPFSVGIKGDSVAVNASEQRSFVWYRLK